MCLLLLKLVDFLSDGAVALVDAAAVAAVRLGDCAVLQNDFHHAAAVQLTAVAGYKNMPVYMLIFYSAFLTVPKSLVEAAQIDGANSLQIFTKIKMPHIRPTIFANILLVLNGSLRGFDIAKLLTAGGPINSSQLQAMYMYKQAFSSQKYGYGSAVAMFIVMESLILAILIRWMSSSKKMGGR